MKKERENEESKREQRFSSAEKPAGNSKTPLWLQNSLIRPPEAILFLPFIILLLAFLTAPDKQSLLILKYLQILSKNTLRHKQVMNKLDKTL